MYTSMARAILIAAYIAFVASLPVMGQVLASADDHPVTGMKGTSEGVLRGTITAPITTGFARYQPYAVPRQSPSVGLGEASPAPDFSNVATPGSFSFSGYFSEKERTLLQREGFVARIEGIGNFGAAYAHEVSPRPLGSFVTVDAVAHGLRVTLDEALTDFETGYATSALKGEFSTLATSIRRRLDGATSRTLKQSLRSLLGYLQTGEALLDPTAKLDPLVAPDVRSEVGRIVAATGTGESSVLKGVRIDYSLFRPLGRYASSEGAIAFFRARQWAARVPFVVRDVSGSVDPEGTRMALLLTRSIASLTGQGDFDRARRSLDEPIAFLTGGYGDGMSWETIATAVRRYYGVLAGEGDAYLAGDEEVADLARHVAQGSSRTGGILFRLHNWEDGRRSDPIAEFVRVASANPSAYRSLFGLRTGETSEAWMESIDRAFLYTLQPLALDSYGDEGFPRFMRGGAWRDRGLASALGGAADIALPLSTVTMKSLPKSSRYGSAGEPGTDGYVEPSPAAWGRLASLAGYLHRGLTDEMPMVSPGIAAKLADIEKASARLMHIAAAELEGEALTADDHQVIASMRTRIIAYETPVDAVTRRRGYTTTRSLAIRGGNGYPMAIYVVVPRNDGIPGLMLTRGAIYTYVDQVDPQGAVRGDLLPVSWSSTFIDADRSFRVDSTRLLGLVADIPVDDLSRASAREEQKGLARFTQLDLESSTVSRANGELWFTVGVEENDRRELFVTILDGSGRGVRRMDLGRLRERRHLDLFRIDDLPEGGYTIVVEDAVGNRLASGRFRVQ